MTFKVTARFFTTLREMAGRKEDHVEFSKAATVNSLLKHLSKKYGKEFDNYIFDELGEVRGHLQILINGQSITKMRGMKTKLKEGDQIAILPPVGGG